MKHLAPLSAREPPARALCLLFPDRMDERVDALLFPLRAGLPSAMPSFTASFPQPEVAPDGGARTREHVAFLHTPPFQQRLFLVCFLESKEDRPLLTSAIHRQPVERKPSMPRPFQARGQRLRPKSEGNRL